MGLDGGTIISRSDVLRGASWELSQADTSKSTRGGSITRANKRRKLNTTETKQVKWTSCALTSERLQPPIVADYLGNLYNKSAIIEFLLARQGVFTEDDSSHKYVNQIKSVGMLEHIRNIKDTFQVYLNTHNTEEQQKHQHQQDTANNNEAELHHCPITDVGCDKATFLAIPQCGHIMSERGMQSAHQHGGVCPICNNEFDIHEAVVINPVTEEQRTALEEKLKERQHAAQLKKEKKKQKKEKSKEKEPHL